MGYEGLGGAFLLAVGGTIVFAMLLVFLESYRYQSSGIMTFYLIFIFFGLFVLGLGLWLIAQSGKSETKQTPS